MFKGKKADSSPDGQPELDYKQSKFRTNNYPPRDRGAWVYISLI